MKRTTVLAFALVSLAACKATDKTGPSGPVEQVSFELCDGFRPQWMAIQNEGDAWRRINVPVSGPVTFDATEKVSIAMSFSLFGAFTSVMSVARDEITGSAGFLFGCDVFATGNLQLTGTATGFDAQSIAMITAAYASASADAQNPGWTLTDLPGTPVDLVAVRYGTGDAFTADRVIIRRNQMPSQPGSGTVPVLNFADAPAPDVATLTVSNAGADAVDVISTLITATGTSSTLAYDFGTGGTLQYYAVPAALQVASDRHELNVIANSGESRRELRHFYQGVSNRTVTLGPPLSTPNILSAGTSPYVRMRFQLPSQPEYPTGVAAVFYQLEACGEACFNVRFFSIYTSAEFLGGRPATWDVTMPDLTAAEFQADWGPQSGKGTVEWDITALGPNAAPFFGGSVPVGTTIVSAARSSGGDIGFARVEPRTKRRHLGIFGPPLHPRLP